LNTLILVAGTGLEPATFGLWAPRVENFRRFYWAQPLSNYKIVCKNVCSFSLLVILQKSI